MNEATVVVTSPIHHILFFIPLSVYSKEDSHVCFESPRTDMS